MVIFLVALAVSAARAQFSLIAARFRRAMFFLGLVLATEVAFVVIVVMRIVAALFIVVVAIAAARLAIFGLIAALLVGVLGLFVWGWCPWRCQSTCLRCLSASGMGSAKMILFHKPVFVCQRRLGRLRIFFLREKSLSGLNVMFYLRISAMKTRYFIENS